MGTRMGYERWPAGDIPSQCQIAVVLFLLVIATVFVIYGGLSQGAIMSLLGFVPLLMSGMKKKKKKERHRISFIKKIMSSEEMFGTQSSIDETAVCIRDFTLAKKEQQRKKISYSRIFLLFRSKPASSKDIFTISGDICEMDDLENGRSTNG
ncbi:uncharacterized protein [Halyomorpha halys]|uniref:uncharacterized protein n=1 Tax=Halyomorpha halys TaxID=286706 RepID=UPI0006D502F4|nr:uncharacterized protein LOC106679239 [Halyomorpha halys]